VPWNIIGGGSAPLKAGGGGSAPLNGGGGKSDMFWSAKAQGGQRGATVREREKLFFFLQKKEKIIFFFCFFFLFRVISLSFSLSLFLSLSLSPWRQQVSRTRSSERGGCARLPGNQRRDVRAQRGLLAHTRMRHKRTRGNKQRKRQKAEKKLTLRFVGFSFSDVFCPFAIEI
jgi:hypothetical protein